MSAEQFRGPMGAPQSDRRTLLIGAVIAILLLAGLVAALIRWVSPDDRLLVLLPEAAQVAEGLEEGDRVRITGTLRDFDAARAVGDDPVAFADDDVDGANVLRAHSVRPAGDGDAATEDLLDLRDEEAREGDRVTVVAKVEESLGDDLFTIAEAD